MRINLDSTPTSRGGNGITRCSLARSVRAILAVSTLSASLLACGGSSGATQSRKSDLKSSNACGALVRYAYQGFPASTVDEVDNLLSLLSLGFQMEKREDISSQIDNITPLIYQGFIGQITARGQLRSLASAIGCVGIPSGGASASGPTLPYQTDTNQYWNANCPKELRANESFPLMKCDKGKKIRVVQQKLGINADGLFGNDTVNALLDYQDRCGLPTSGMVDQATWDSLQSDSC